MLKSLRRIGRMTHAHVSAWAIEAEAELVADHAEEMSQLYGRLKTIMPKPQDQTKEPSADEIQKFVAEQIALLRRS